MRSKSLVLAGLLALTLSACSGDEVPPADEVIPDAASAMAEVENVRFDLAVDGEIPGLDVKAADGVVTADGAAEGTGTLTALGMDIEAEYVVIGEEAWVKGPTGGFQQIPVGDDMLPYDPTVLLSPDRGVSALLEAVDSAEPQGAEEVGGVDAYRYAVVFDPAAFAEFIPAEGDWNDATVWFDQETSRVVKAEFAQGDATVTLLLSDYDESVTIDAP
ncbi:LppX_LprAFG lipoprotein [Glycomyces sp. TRM65418]|uniref:LppX_LprAFG lipoprotein n=1 Tax=Glycomyces sp. TRM65418 TaxID=2867006 RepID=UPI001CE56940|nr:LppX_LprAFG lipoprotein [Glycomyces sp. TRM65418]MCC3763695.1 LppX_LprAFG lipoprotein [Glycomyces sp. TRM65418]QZD57674.1 LppX_LprAFG lipoprotein [Glycomyces sp. TRM65418]